MGPDGPSDLADADARRLQVALGAVVGFDFRGPVVLEVARTRGRVALAAGAHGDFVFTQRLSST